MLGLQPVTRTTVDRPIGVTQVRASRLLQPSVSGVPQRVGDDAEIRPFDGDRGGARDADAMAPTVNVLRGAVDDLASVQLTEENRPDAGCGPQLRRDLRGVRADLACRVDDSLGV